MISCAGGSSHRVLFCDGCDSCSLVYKINSEDHLKQHKQLNKRALEPSALMIKYRTMVYFLANPLVDGAHAFDADTNCSTCHRC